MTTYVDKLLADGGGCGHRCCSCNDAGCGACTPRRPHTDWQVAVPSHARADKVNRQALTALANAGVDPERVRVFVAPDELDTYRAAVDPGLACEVLPGALTLRAQRSAIEAWHGDGARLVQMDDDVRAVVGLGADGKLTTEVDLSAAADDAFEQLAATGSRLWGVYPVPNAGWMKERVRWGLVFCWGSLFGQVVDLSLPLVLSQKEDYERSLRYWEAHGPCARLEWLSVRTTMYAPGGMQAEDQAPRDEANEAAVDYLLEEWPAYVRVNKRRRSAVGREVLLLEQRLPHRPSR